MRENKIPYILDQESRWKIAEDYQSQERFALISERYSELRSAFPEINLAFALGGSLVKGKVLTKDSRHGSDVDLSVYYEVNIFKDDGNDEIWNRFVDHSKRLSDKHVKYVKADSEPFRIQDLEEIYYHRIKWDIIRLHRLRSEEELKTLTEKEWKEAERLFKTEAKEYALERYLSEMFKHFSDMKVSASCMVFTGNPEEELFSKLTDEGYFFNQNEVEVDRVRVYLLFGYDMSDPSCKVVHGCRKYIQDFLLYISTMPNKEELWQKIREGTIVWERDIDEKDISSKLTSKLQVQYPKTFKDACEYYGVK